MRASDFGTSRDVMTLPMARRRRVVVVRLFRIPRWTWVGALLLAVLAGVAFASAGFRYRTMAEALADLEPPAAVTRPKTTDVKKLQAEQKRLRAALTKKVPSASYIVIDQANNRLYLKRGAEVQLAAVCSAGSGIVLREGDAGRKWVFDTPRGHFKVLQRIENPVWRKPDWAFVEEGKPIPKDPGERMEYGTLGEYALYFGNGYMVHGTLYERLLGRSVTHGCIRLGRDNLRQVWQATKHGTPIYIF